MAKTTPPAKYPQIGLDSAHLHFGDILLPAYRDWEQAQTRANALAIAQSAWQLCERYWHDKGCPGTITAFRESLSKSCPELKLMRDYAETGKHSGLTRPSVQLVSITGFENPGGTLTISPGLSSDPTVPFRPPFTTTPTCTLTLNAGGKAYPLLDLLKRVVEFWRKELLGP
jgi:hypothetical protein